jgi:hypothetical protein
VTVLVLVAKSGSMTDIGQEPFIGVIGSQDIIVLHYNCLGPRDHKPSISANSVACTFALKVNLNLDSHFIHGRNIATPQDTMITIVNGITIAQ